MKNYLIILLLTFNVTFSQSTKTLDETKSYITRTINEYGWEENSTKHRLKAEFEGDLLKVTTMNKTILGIVDKTAVYNFASVYRFKGPIKDPGDIAHLIIWVDRLMNEQTGKWKKDGFDFEIHNYEVGEQLMAAFVHLNKLLMASKPQVEQF